MYNQLKIKTRWENLPVEHDCCEFCVACQSSQLLEVSPPLKGNVHPRFVSGSNSFFLAFVGSSLCFCLLFQCAVFGKQGMCIIYLFTYLFNYSVLVSAPEAHVTG